MDEELFDKINNSRNKANRGNSPFNIRGYDMQWIQNTKDPNIVKYLVGHYMGTDLEKQEFGKIYERYVNFKHANGPDTNSIMKEFKNLADNGYLNQEHLSELDNVFQDYEKKLNNIKDHNADRHGSKYSPKYRVDLDMNGNYVYADYQGNRSVDKNKKIEFKDGAFWFDDERHITFDEYREKEKKLNALDGKTDEKVSTTTKEVQNASSDNTTNPKDLTHGTQSNADIESTASPKGDKQNKGVSVGDVVKEEAKMNARTEPTRIKNEGKLKSQIRNTKAAGIAGFGLIGLTAIMDMSKSLQQDVEVSKMKNQQEKNQKRKQKEERDFQSTMAYGYTNWGQIPLDMFNERLGHTKIGNAKFK
ncbi:hypothetical protein_gp120 [Bacillus phage vB_BceM_WH1]|nr:hypothetical protein_gp120 [Bacillus phage vB_BceM_WH1]